MTDHAQEFFKPGISATSINDFYKSPAHFWRNSSYNPQRVRRPATPAMIFGRLVHCMILTPENLGKEFLLAPAGINKRTKEGAAQWDALKKEAGRRDIVDPEDHALAASMRDAMFANEAVRRLIGNGVSESPFTWRREASGLMCKTRLDYVRSGLVIEYKTTTDCRPDEMAKTISNFGYHRQLAWEVEAATLINGEAPKGAVIICQDKEVHDAIGIYALDTETLRIGARENDFAYGEIRRRMETKDWRAFPEEIVALGLPRWYRACCPE